MSDVHLFFRSKRWRNGRGLLELVPKTRRRVEWRFVGSDEWFVSRNRFMALLHAAWTLGVSGLVADWRKVREWRPAAHRETEVET